MFWNVNADRVGDFWIYENLAALNARSWNLNLV